MYGCYKRTQTAVAYYAMRNNRRHMKRNLSIYSLTLRQVNGGPLFTPVDHLHIGSSKLQHFWNPLILGGKKSLIKYTTFSDAIAPIYISSWHIQHGDITAPFSYKKSEYLVFDNVKTNNVNPLTSSLIEVSGCDFTCRCSNFMDIEITSQNPMFYFSYVETIFDKTYFSNCKVPFIYCSEGSKSISMNFSQIHQNNAQNLVSVIKQGSNALMETNISKVTGSGNSLLLYSDLNTLLFLRYSTLVECTGPAIFTTNWFQKNDPKLFVSNVNFLRNTNAPIIETDIEFTFARCVFIGNTKIASVTESPVGPITRVILIECSVDVSFENAGAVTGDSSQFGKLSATTIGFAGFTKTAQCPTYSPTASPSMSPHPTPTASSSPSPSPSASPSPSKSFSPSKSPLPTPTDQTPGPTPIPTRSVSPSMSPRPTPTASGSPSISVSATASASLKPTPSPGPTADVLGIVMVTVPTVLCAIVIPLIVIFSIRAFNEMSSAEAIPFLPDADFVSEGSMTSSRSDPLDTGEGGDIELDSDDDFFRRDLPTHNRMFAGRVSENSGSQLYSIFS